MKVLLRKYYHKANANGSMSSQDQDSPYVPYLKAQKTRLGQRLTVNTSMKQTSSPAEFLNTESPKTAGPLTYGNFESDQNSSELLKPPPIQLTKGKSLFCHQKSINDSPGRENTQDDTNEHSIYNTTPSREGEYKRYLEETKSSSRGGQRVHTVTYLPTQTSETEDFPQRKTKTLVLDSSGIPRKIENLLEEGCKEFMYSRGLI